MTPMRLTRGLREQIAEEIRLELVAGKHAAGTPMIERAVAQRFDVSHAPVREAFLQLSQEGYLVAQTNYGVRVAGPASPRMIELFLPFRQRLEKFALELMAGRLPRLCVAWREQWPELQAAVESGDAGRLASWDLQWHTTLVESADEPDLLHTWRTLSSRARLTAEDKRVAALGSTLLAQHERMLRACELGDVATAGAVLEENLASEAGLT